MRKASNSDPKYGESSEWVRISEPPRERLAEESLADYFVEVYQIGQVGRVGGSRAAV
jgi:hypothetical protein